MQVKRNGDVTYEDISPYVVPAQDEDELYKQIRCSGIQQIAKDSIVWDTDDVDFVQ